MQNSGLDGSSWLMTLLLEERTRLSNIELIYRSY